VYGIPDTCRWRDGIEVYIVECSVMKRIALLVIAFLAASALVFGGGRQSGGASSSAGGLTTIKAWGINGKRVIGQSQVSLADWYSGAVPSRYWDKFTEEMTKRGVRLELDLIESDQGQTVFQTLLASGRLNDYDWICGETFVDERTRMALVSQNRMYPISRAIQEYSDGPARDFYFNDPVGISYVKHTALEDGTLYWLTNGATDYYGARDNYISQAPVSNIRVDWLRKVGLEFPPKTLDDFYNALVAFRTNDVNGNGVRDEVANANISTFWNGIGQWFGLGPQLISSIDGRAVSPWYQTHAKDYFAYMNRLYRAGLLRVGGESNDMAANKIAYDLLWLPDYWSESTVVVQNGADKPYYAPFLVHAFADDPPRIRTQDGVATQASSLFFIPSGSKNVEKAVKMIDYFVTDDYFILNEYGIEGYTFKYGADGIPEKLPNSSSMIGNDYDIFPALWTANTVFPRFQKGDSGTEMVTLRVMASEMGYPDGFKLKFDFADNYFARNYAFAYNIDAQMAFPTSREMDRISALFPDLNTYSEELMASLVIGDKSLDNWESYMADLRRLGLDELVAIYQARMDRVK
jgi:ABC-type glycerol-3-phosphate transport system substrate-binding protein